MSLHKTVPRIGFIRGVEHRGRFLGEKDTIGVWRGRPLRKGWRDGVLDRQQENVTEQFSNNGPLYKGSLHRQWRLHFISILRGKKAYAAVQKIWFQYNKFSFNEQNQS